MRGRAAWLLSAFVLALPVLAQARVTLRVEATDDARSACPTETALTERLQAANLRGSYTVRFARAGRGFEVRITGDDEKTMRDPSCAALGDAVVATLLVLAEGTEADANVLGSDAGDAATAETSDAAVPAADAAPDEPDAAAPSAPTGPPLEGSFGAMLGLANGVGSSVAPTVALFGRIAPFSRLRLGGGARYAFVADRVVGAGTVARTVVGGWVEACYPIYGATVRFSGCAYFAVHAITATASGFPSNGSATLPRVSVGPALEFDDASLRPVSWLVRAELDVPILREAFTISGAGPDYEA
ncbi:MAG: hypothetical protein HOO96_23495, partial [Polyangiaceae bacterium]|nr:hypothetical protein [Polyangiaceae bacterium]